MIKIFLLYLLICAGSIFTLFVNMCWINFSNFTSTK